MPVDYEKRDHIAIVTLSRPHARNAWGDDFNKGLARCFAEMEDDDDVRGAILTGDEAGGAFSAGANLKDAATQRYYRDLMQLYVVASLLNDNRLQQQVDKLFAKAGPEAIPALVHTIVVVANFKQGFT